MIVREQHSADAGVVREVLTSAFGDGGGVADLAEALAARADTICPPLVAEDDGAVVGVVQVSRGWIDAERALVPVAVLSPLGVAPSRRRRGVGRALCAAAAEQARALGVPALFLEGDPAYYARLGWQRADVLGFGRPSPRIPAVAFEVMTFPSWQPWMVGPLVYNDTFWAHDCVGLRET